jgi:hypothetical protein
MKHAIPFKMTHVALPKMQTSPGKTGPRKGEGDMDRFSSRPILGLVTALVLLSGLFFDGPGRAQKTTDKGSKEPPKKTKLSPEKLEQLWASLGGEDASEAYRAGWVLIDAPEQSVPFLQKKLQPVGPVDPKKVGRFIGELDHRSFRVREKATKELANMAELAEPALRKAWKGQVSKEGTKRLANLLDKRDKEFLTSEQVRMIRAIEVLELIGTSNAQKVVQTLTRGVKGARVTQEAKETLKRLKKNVGRLGSSLPKGPKTTRPKNQPSRSETITRSGTIKFMPKREPIAFNTAAFSPDGEFTFCGKSDGSLCLWNLATGERVRSFLGYNPDEHGVFEPRPKVRVVVFLPSGKHALSGGQDKRLKMWDLQTSKEIFRFKKNRVDVTCLAISPDGKTALCNGPQHTVRTWNVETGKPIRSFVGHHTDLAAVAYSPNGHYGASAGYDDTIRVWNLNTGSQVRVIAGYREDDAFYSSLAFSPTGRFLLSAAGKLRMYEMATGKEVKVFRKAKAWSNWAGFLPSNKQVLSTNAQSYPFVWDLKTNEVKQTIHWSDWRGSDFATISPDGTLILLYSMDSLVLWDLTKGKKVRTLAGPSRK